MPYPSPLVENTIPAQGSWSPDRFTQHDIVMVFVVIPKQASAIADWFAHVVRPAAGCAGERKVEAYAGAAAVDSSGAGAGAAFIKVVAGDRRVGWGYCTDIVTALEPVGCQYIELRVTSNSVFAAYIGFRSILRNASNRIQPDIVEPYGIKGTAFRTCTRAGLSCLKSTKADIDIRDIVHIHGTQTWVFQVNIPLLPR